MKPRLREQRGRLVKSGRSRAALRRYQRILAAFDGSEDSKRALAHAKRLAQRNGATLAVIQVVPPLISDADFGYGPVRRRIVDGHAVQETNRRLRKIMGSAGTAFVRSGSACAQILKAAEDLHADVIVMGGHQNGLPESMVCGEKGITTADKARCPVLIVRGDSVEIRPAPRVDS